jgi:hypothetical protein
MGIQVDVGVRKSGARNGEGHWQFLGRHNGIIVRICRVGIEVRVRRIRTQNGKGRNWLLASHTSSVILRIAHVGIEVGVRRIRIWNRGC